jgi:dihydroorotate dehydrogenase (fumarate)
LQGFAHDDAVNQYAFFNPQDHSSDSDSSRPSTSTASLNTLGYSPIPLATYLSFITNITTKAEAASKQPPTRTKPFIISITGSPTDIAESYRLISAAQAKIPATNSLCIEINLSCPNIPDKPPPAYSKIALFEYLKVLENVQREVGKTGAPKIAVGLKTPPYTYADQFRTLIDALLEAPECEISFLTATNTLGSSLLLQADGDNNGYSPTLSSASGLGIGGLAGAPLHPLALGNVKTLRGLLDLHEELRGVQVIGVGGVGDSEGFARMRAVGASVVGVGTALGREGMEVFGKILGRVEGARL